MLAYTDNVALIAENREDLTACAEQLLIDRSLSSTAQGQWRVPTYMKIWWGFKNEEFTLKVVNYSFELSKELYLGVTFVNSNRRR